MLGLCFNIALFYSLNMDKMYEYNGNVEIISLGNEKGTKVKYICATENNKKLVLYVSNNNILIPGEIIYIKGKIEFAEEVRNYKGFNQKKNFFQDKIYGSVAPQKIKRVGIKKDIYYFIGHIKEILYQIMDDNYDHNISDFLKALLFGDKSELEENIVKNFRKSSMSHILAISGMHISYIVTTINTILKKITIHKRKKEIITISFLVFFLIFTGMSPSCTRACLMYVLGIIGSLLHRKNNNYILLITSFLIIITLNIYDFYSVGLWLSCMATLGIMVFAKFISKCMSIKLKNNSNIVSNYIINCLAISISAQIMILPIALYNFNTISLNFFIPNILISVFIGPIIILGYVSILMGLVFYPFVRLISFVETIMVSIVFRITEWSSQIPLSLIYLITPSFLSVILYYVLILWWIVLYRQNNYRILRKIFNNHRRYKNKTN